MRVERSAKVAGWMTTEVRSSAAGGNGLATTDDKSGDELSSSPHRVRQVSLRIPADILERVDAAVQNRRIRIPRHTWLLEALVEKLEREAPHCRGDHGTE